ncbi:permease [Bradyrhizobium sp. ISRA443]|uniref:permease n=1 Tax=unclassified Bradyrhizobium TaxID=2631580 RepID=UPI00247A5A9F|nr:MULTISPECIES: permease [unclassified Bradyrhizobium]WGR94164.1 permease [Bradyrhizobium sp. ISRA435]WGR98840.1 permease [Bradyrhizobium sp. ISRA436]WGS05731.1 permease [Bradyrhizobium sp. ISRA437]WGS12617.1 permease [Bradyrhizobium sp. ISRA443]
MSSAAHLSWFVRHEFRLAWREWLAMMTGGRRRRNRAVIGLLIVAAILHLPAYAVVGRFADLQFPLDPSSLIVLTATIFLSWALMLSQAIESVTRVFYARADLDLIMSSPAKLTNIFSVRIAAIGMSVTGMALLLSAPFVDVLVILGGAHWLAGFGVVVAIGLTAAAAAIAIAVLLFRLIGPSRTRLMAQIVSAIIGAGFVIALQIVAILSYGTLSRFAVLTSDTAARIAPGLNSLVWWPARAALGDLEVMMLLVAGALIMLGVVMAVFAPRFADTVTSVAANPAAATRRRDRSFRVGSRQQALRRKEFLLLRRDPWLLSQSLMQMLYLVPPALMLWRSFSDSSTAIVLITPVVVMAAGQLAGGLAWLTISGEDAADLVATAPLPPSRVVRAKIEVVLIAIASIFAPLVGALAFVSPRQAAVTTIAVIVATGSAAAVQLWFRAQAKRSQFRRRQTSSRVATFAEAFCSIGWAATAALALTIPAAAIVSGVLTLMTLAIAWKISPKRA